MKDVTLEQAKVLFLEDSSRRLRPSSWRTYLWVLRHFQKHCGLYSYSEIMPYHVTSFVEERPGEKYRRESILRNFLGWSNKRFQGHVFVPPIRSVRTPFSLREHLYGSVLLQQAKQVKEAVSRFAFPHQKAIFLCGFWYGMPLSIIQKITLSELLELPKRPEFYALLDEVVKVGGPREGAFFEPWLRRGIRVVEQRWKAWSGGVPFKYVVGAGNVERALRGIRPVRGRRHSANIFAALPPMDDEKITQMPWPWED